MFQDTSPDKLKGSLPHDDDYLSVYVPTTPNPTGGYYIMVKKSDVRELDMSVDDALKYVISLGMVIPDEVPAKAFAECRPSENGDTEQKQLRCLFRRPFLSF